MTSIGSFVKQIPLNNGYFRPQPDLAAAMSTIGLVTGVGANQISSYMYTFNSSGAFPTTFTPGNASTAVLLQAGGCLLRDMGTQILSTNTAGNSSPVVFRRVQIVDTALGGAVTGTGLSTDGVGGSYTASTDSSYNCAYILMGFNGAAPVGPFVRTG
jgi:hypothetical protein